MFILGGSRAVVVSISRVDNSLKEKEKKECLRGALAPLLKNLPLPLVKGKGIRGWGSED